MMLQDMHWYNFHINILVHITYKKNLDFVSTTLDQSPLVLKYTHYHILDDKTHDSLFVQHVLTLCQEYLKGKDAILKNTSFGLMGFLHNSKVQKILLCCHVFASYDPRGCKCIGIFLHLVTRMARLIVYVHSSNGRFARKSNHKQQGYKMHMMLSFFVNKEHVYIAHQYYLHSS